MLVICKDHTRMPDQQNIKYYRPIYQEYNEHSPRVPDTPPLDKCCVTTLILAHRTQLTCKWKHKTVYIVPTKSIKDNTTCLTLVFCGLLTLGMANELNDGALRGGGGGEDGGGTAYI